MSLAPTTEERQSRDFLHLSVSYMDAIYEPDELILTAEARLQHVDFDTFVGTGLSGSLVLPTLARALGKKFLVVRKPEDSSHSYLDFEGYLGGRWLFVDDFVDTGRTFQRVYSKITNTILDRGFDSQLAGAFLYSSVRPYRTPHHMMSTLREYERDFGLDETNA